MKAQLPNLPEPNAEELSRAAAVGALVEAKIKAHDGCLAFDRFMELALYAPALGYYTGGAIKLGAHGDFVTAPELGSLFGRCLARRCADALAGHGSSVLEFGAGSGALCSQVLVCLAELGQLPDRYLILETSADLTARQKEALSELPPELARRVVWLDRLPEARFEGVVIANEVLDAMPVSRFRVTERGHEILGVRTLEDGLGWCGMPCQEPATAIDRLIDRHRLPAGYVSEYHGRAGAWVRRIPEWLERGVVFIIDYGYPAAEYYHPERSTGTLKCFFHHVAHDDPLVLPGIQDITAHLDFSAIADVASGIGLDVLGFTSLGAFLIESGLMLDLAVPATTPAAQMALANEVKRLTLPGEMGEIFKVLAIGRNSGMAPGGFGRSDRRHTLAGQARR